MKNTMMPSRNSLKGIEMPKRSKAELDILITVAAGLFATHTRDAKEIANLLNTSERSGPSMGGTRKMGRGSTNPRL